MNAEKDSETVENESIKENIEDKDSLELHSIHSSATNQDALGEEQGCIELARHDPEKAQYTFPIVLDDFEGLQGFFTKKGGFFTLLRERESLERKLNANVEKTDAIQNIIERLHVPKIIGTETNKLEIEEQNSLVERYKIEDEFEKRCDEILKYNPGIQNGDAEGGVIMYNYEQIIVEKEKIVAEMEKIVAEKEKIVTEKEKIDAEKEKIVAEKEKIVAEKEKIIAEKETIVAEKEKIVAMKENIITEKEKLVAEKETIVAQKEKIVAMKENIITEEEKIVAEKKKLAPENGKNDR